MENEKNEQAEKERNDAAFATWQKHMELLWKAYPDGYLAKRGAVSIDGWNCDRVTPVLHFSRIATFTPPGMFWVSWYPYGDNNIIRGECGFERVDTLKPNGKLLPDLTDCATFHRALEELAEASGALSRPWSPNYSYLWAQGSAQEREELDAPPFWKLLLVDAGGWCTKYFDPLDTDDPVEALLLARIGVREGR